MAGVAEDVQSGFAYLNVLPDVRSDKHGLIGFCWGGEMTFASATQLNALDAAVVFYGRSPSPLESVKNIRAPLMAHHGEKDPRVNKGIDETVAAMKNSTKLTITRSMRAPRTLSIMTPIQSGIIPNRLRKHGTHSGFLKKASARLAAIP